MDNELMHYGVLGMHWGIRRYQNKDGSLTPAGKKRSKQKIEYAEKYLGRKLKTDDGFEKNGLDITKKRLKKIKQYDEQENRYNSVKKKSDPDYDYLRGYNLKTGTSLSAKDVDRIIKKLNKNPSTNVIGEMQSRQIVKQGRKQATNYIKTYGKATVASIASIAVTAFAYNAINKNK